MESRRGIRHGYKPRNYPRPGEILATVKAVGRAGASLEIHCK